MAQTQRIGWNMAAAVAAVMALVFAALVSSWLGMNAEQDGKDAVLALAFDQLVRDPPAFAAAIGRFADRPLDDELLASLRVGFDACPSEHL